MCHGMCGSAKCAEDASASIQYMHRYFSYALVPIVNLFFLLSCADTILDMDILKHAFDGHFIMYTCSTAHYCTYL